MSPNSCLLNLQISLSFAMEYRYIGLKNLKSTHIPQSHLNGGEGLRGVFQALRFMCTLDWEYWDIPFSTIRSLKSYTSCGTVIMLMSAAILMIALDF
jgi:hypothetical protein